MQQRTETEMGVGGGYFKRWRDGRHKFDDTMMMMMMMSKAFEAINIHALIRKLIHTKIPGTLIKFIVNYIKGRKAYTTYRNYTSIQHTFKTGIP